MKFRDIPQMSNAHYQVNVSWSFLKNWLKNLEDDGILEMNPEYQRGYVWTEEQKIAYIEYILKGGRSGRNVYWNSAGWMRGIEDKAIELVDGKQRVSAVLDFLDNKIKAFDHYYRDFTDKLAGLCGPDFLFYVNDLEDPAEVVQWYLDMNTGGSIHTEEDLSVARRVLEDTKRGD